jgi:triacylglycerol lipase
MSYVIAAPEMLAAAAADVAGIGSSLSEANAAAATQTTGVLAAAEDEVSAAIAALFSAHGQGFHALGARFTAAAEQFTETLKSSAGSFASAEAQAVSTLGSIFAAPAITPVPATGNPTFTGTPSQLTRLEDATFLKVIGDFFKLPVVDRQLVTPGSPLLWLLAHTSDIPGVSLIDSNSPPKFLPLLLGETVQHTTYDGMPVVQITPAHPDGNYVVAMHGGGFLQPLLTSWIDYSMMAHQTGATIEVPMYPLVQEGGTAAVVIPKMAGLISSEIAAHGASHVSVLGDSAGGSMALASVEYLVAHNETVPASMVLLSPVTDNSWSNPAIGSIKGSWLPPTPTMQQFGKEWAGNLPLDNYEVSPLYGSLQGLPPTTIYAGSHDIVAPDLLLLQQKAVGQGAPISFVLANGETHDWLFVTPDTLHYWPQIDQELGA